MGLGSDLDGGFAEYVKISEGVLAPYPGCLWIIPENLSYEEAAILDPAANGYCAVIQHGQLMAGESVAVVGAGPLGLSCMAAAKVGGAAHIIAYVKKTTSKRHRDCAYAFGATEVLDDEDAFRDHVKSLTNGEGLSIVY